MWIPVRTADGSWTLRHSGHGEACHSTAGAWQQARERYAGPCRLRELGMERGRVRLLDVGTGLGLNLAAALAALDGTGARLEALSLEVDPEVIRAGLELGDWPAEVELRLAPVRAALQRALDAHERPVTLGGGALTLLLGDARERLPTAAARAFDAVFLDPFSPAVDPPLWDAEFLARIASRMEPWAVLSTYSASLRVRRALAAAGLRVGRGPRVGRKAEGTLASQAQELPALDARTARRLARPASRG